MRSMSIYIPSNTTIIPVNTFTLSKTLTLPSVSTSPGRIVIIKDTYGTASSQYIQLSTTGIDTVERGSTQSIRLSTSYGSWMFTNDGVTTWFLVDTYKNSLSQQLVAALPPFATPAITVSFVPNTLSSSWVASINAVSYTVSYYYNQVESTTGGTLIQTFTGLTAITHSFTETPNVNYYYYATVTSINVNSSSSTTSAAVYAIVTPSPPTNVVVLFDSNVLSCAWTLAANTTTYTVVFYETLTPVTTGGSVFQTITGIVLLYYSSALNVYQGRYYYATVQSCNLSGNSAAITSSNSVLGAAIPLPPPSASITIPGQSAVASWSAAVNAITYTVEFYYVNTAVTTGGTLLETVTGISALTQTTSVTLLINKYYYATITSVNSYGQSAATTTATTTAQYGFAPPATTSVSIAVSGMNVVASWASALNTNTYTIIFYEVNSAVTTGGSVFETVTGQAGLTQTSSTPLVNGKYYYATVMSVNQYGNSSVVTSATASAQIAIAPQPPTGISVVYSGSLSTSWSAALNATTYTVVFYRVTTNVTTGGVLTETNTGVAALTQTIVSSPLAGYYYYTTVTSYNTYGNSATITSGNAAQITVAPSLPTSVSIVLSGYYLVCSWTAAADTTTYTVLFYQNTSATTTGGTLFETATLQSGPSTTSTTMAVNTYYYYATVTSVNGYASSSPVLSSSSTSQIQIAPTNPSNVAVSLSAAQITASWTASTYYATSYTVVFYEVASNVTTGGTVFETNTGVTGTSRLTSTSLVNGQYYYATVTAVNTIPLSSSTITSSTAVLALLYVQNPSISVSNSTGVASLSWSAVSGATLYSYVLYQASANNYTSGSVVVYATTASTSVTTNTYAAAYYYFTVTATTPGGSTLIVASSIVQSTYILLSGPTNVSGLSIWLDGTDTTGTGATLTNGASFTTWVDKSGNSNNFTKTAGTITNLVDNSKFVVNVPSAAIMQSANQINFTTSSAFFVVSKFTSNSNLCYVIGLLNIQPASFAGDYSIRFSGGTGLQGTTALAGNSNDIGNTNYYVNGSFNPNFNSSYYFNVYSVIATQVPTQSGTSYVTISDGSVLGRYMIGYVAEFLYYQNGVTNTNRQLLEGYLAWKWGFQTSLSAGHPYLSAAPVSSPSPAVTNPYVITATNVATMSWSAYSGATGYVWTLFQTTNTNFTGIILGSGTTNSSTLTATYTGLTLTNYYYFSVYATTSSTPSAYGTSPLSLYNNGVPTGGAVTLNTFTALTGGSFVITSSAMNTTTYTYYISTTTGTGGSIGSSTTTLVGSATSFTLTLAGGTTYYAVVVPSNTFGNGTAFYSAGVATLAAPVGGSITLASGLSSTSGSVTITAASPATSYTVYISTTTSSAQSVYSFSTTTTGSAVAFTPSPSLSGSTTYYAVLLPVNSYVNGTFSNSAGVATLAAPVGGSITLAAGLTTTSGSVTITAATNATSYTVYISTTTSSAQSVYSFSTTTTGSAVAFTPSPSLTGSTTYYAVLLPVNSYGNGTFSNSAGVTSVVRTTTTFNYTGSTQTYTVPVGYTSINVILRGGGGGGGGAINGYTGGNGGSGGYVSGTLAVTPGQVLTLYVAGGGGGETTGPTVAGGFGGGGGASLTSINGGGGGGGASYILLTGVLKVAAGGGGGGGAIFTRLGGNGGGLIGQDGSMANSGGTQSAGGFGFVSGGYPNGTGAYLSGGYATEGGGGGGGYYGGGGYSGSSSGGGGSSYVALLTGTVVNTQGGGAAGGTGVTNNPGFAGANGSISIT